MLEVLTDIPAYSSKAPTHITRQAYNNAVGSFRKHLMRAFEIFNAFWRTNDDVLLNLSLEELMKARNFMDVIVYAGGDKVADKLNKRATFMYDLAATMMGAKK